MVEKSTSQPVAVAAVVDDVASSGATMLSTNEQDSEKDEDEKLDRQEKLQDENVEKMVVEEIEEEEDSCGKTNT